ncbi:MAG: alpha/beta hydrolase [Pelagimonas sp.]|jgi:acetyl esterase/lipase|nr:alpha/beta hydrolase [Pelagimonas sp.]
MSFAARCLNRWLRWTEKPALRRADDPVKFRKTVERRARLFFHGPKVPWCRKTYANVPGLEITPQGADASAVILYFHGGGYVFGSSRMYRPMMSKIAKQAGIAAVLPDYRLAPEHLFPAAFEDGLAIYQELSKDRQVILGGDSAGGGIALAVLAEVLQCDLPKPLGLFCFSPLLDASLTNPQLDAQADADVILPLEKIRSIMDTYLDGYDPKDPRVSLAFADFAGAPPIWGAISDSEIFAGDFALFVEKLETQHVVTTVEVAQNLPHVWPLFHTLLPEARETLGNLTYWIKGLKGPASES